MPLINDLITNILSFVTTVYPNFSAKFIMEVSDKLNLETFPFNLCNFVTEIIPSFNIFSLSLPLIVTHWSKTIFNKLKIINRI